MRPMMIRLAVLLAAGCGSSSAGDRLCAALAAASNKCGSDCEKAMIKDCSSVVRLLNDTYLNAASDCIQAGSDPMSCFQSAVGQLTPTSAQTSLASAFCNNCAVGLLGCDSVFYSPSGGGAGAAFMPFSDSLATEIASSCTSGFSCAVMFPTCAQAVLLKRSVPTNTLACLLTAAGGQGSGGMCLSQVDAAMTPVDLSGNLDFALPPPDLSRPPPDLAVTDLAHNATITVTIQMGTGTVQVFRNGIYSGQTSTTQDFFFNLNDTFKFSASGLGGQSFVKFCYDLSCTVMTTQNPFSGTISSANGFVRAYFQ